MKTPYLDVLTASKTALAIERVSFESITNSCFTVGTVVELRALNIIIKYIGTVTS